MQDALVRCKVLVAPLAGSVDRNYVCREWLQVSQVAPLAGSVDRNLVLSMLVAKVKGRSPRGERG